MKNVAFVLDPDGYWYVYSPPSLFFVVCIWYLRRHRLTLGVGLKWFKTRRSRDRVIGRREVR